MKLIKKAGIGALSITLSLLAATTYAQAGSISTSVSAPPINANIETRTGRIPAEISSRPTFTGYNPSPSTLTVCAQGKITKLERIRGADNTVRIAAETSPAPYDAYVAVPGLGNMTEVRFGATASDREKDRLGLLQLALAQKLPVQIVTTGPSCVANSDAFDITLCTDGTACAQPR